MAIAFELLDDNSGFVAEVPLVIPLRWRTKTKSTSMLTGSSFDVPTNSTTPTLCGSSTSVGSWNTGGTANPGRQVCKYQNGSAFIIRHEFAILYRPFASWTYVSVSLDTVMVFTDTNIEVDLEGALAAIRDTYDPRFFKIGALRFTDSAGENPVDLVKEGLVSLDTFNSVYQDTKHIGEEVPKEILNLPTAYKFGNYTTPYGPNYPNDETIFNKVTDWTVNGISGDAAGAAFAQTAKNVATNTCVSNGRSIPMYLKVYLAQVMGGSATGDWQNPDATQQTNDGNETNQSSSGAGASGSGIGSSGQGLNSTQTLYGNSNLPFSSVFLTGNNYNNFVAAGGGIVSESGVFPNSTALYIDKVRLSVEGSTMTVVEVKKFDETPSLGLNEKIFGYVFDDNNNSKPVFTGYVVSRQRKLDANTQEITYECRDLSFYFDQLYSPSFYFYRPPETAGGTTKTYDRVLKEILNAAGIPDAIVNIPTVDAPPIDWIYEPVSSVLEWSTKYFGKYVSYIDRYGRLNVRAVDSGSFIKNIPIPSEGTAVGTTYKVLSFNPISDYSRSRSRIILTGDFPLEERVYQGKFPLRGPVNPANAGSTGFYWYYQSISIYGTTRFFYFVFRTSDNLLDKLLSDPQKNADIQLTINVPLSGIGYAPGLVASSTVTLPITDFISTPGSGLIAARLDMSAFGTGSVIPTELVTSPVIPSSNVTTSSADYNFTVRYAIKKNAPLQVQMDTGLTGGTEVLKRPEFKKVSAPGISVDDSPLMTEYLNEIQAFYKPNFGGSLEKDSLDLDLEILGQVSVTGTSLPSAESDNMIIYEIEYDVPKKKTTVSLSNKVYQDLPFFDVIRERSRSANESLVKIGLVEQSALYNQRS